MAAGAASVQRVSRLLAFLLLGLLAVRCATPPQADFQAFASSAREVRMGGHVLYERIAPFIAAAPAAQPQADCLHAALEVPCRFQPPAAGLDPRTAPPELAARLVLLDLSTGYAELLAEVAEGASPARVQARSQQVTALASAALGAIALATPIAPFAPLVAALPQLIERLDQARVNATLNAAILSDRATVQSVLRALEADTAALYDVYAAGRYRDFARARARASSREEVLGLQQAAKRDVEQFIAALNAYVSALRAMSGALDQLAAAAEAGRRPTPASASRDLEQAVAFAVDARRFLDTVRSSSPASQ